MSDLTINRSINEVEAEPEREEFIGSGGEGWDVGEYSSKIFATRKTFQTDQTRKNLADTIRSFDADRSEVEFKLEIYPGLEAKTLFEWLQ